jgi:phenylacetate-CoA ligase
MNNKLLHLFHILPYPLKVLAASAQGYRLRGWRYGPETERLVAEALDRETWSPEKWQAWQAERLAYVLYRAVTKVPYYREQWAQRRRHGDQASWEYLENWPILEKTPLRQNPKAFLAEDCNVSKMYQDGTSGSTGTPLDIWLSRAAVRTWYALFEARWRRWYGVSRHDRWAILGGKLVTPVEQRRAPFWVWNPALNQLYMSTYHLAPDFISHYFNALRRYRIRYLWGYTSALYALAQELLQSGQSPLPMQVVITNAEPLFDYQRQAIAKAFQCQVRETYGMTEEVTAASECEAGRLHLWPEVGITEVLDGGYPVPRGHFGDLIGTGLLNIDMPLVRYRVGDRAAFPSEEGPCRCHRTLPLMGAISGRIDDLVFTPDGRIIGQQLDTIFDSDITIREGQIIQDKIDQFRIRFVPASGFTPEAGRTLISRLHNRIGNVEVILESVSAIPRGANGKFRVVVCNLSADEKRRLQPYAAKSGDSVI